MDNQENFATISEEKTRQDLIDQMNESMENESCDPGEISEDEGGVNAGLIGLLVVGGATLIGGGVKVYKDIKSGKIKQRIDDAKEHYEVQRQNRRGLKEMKDRHKKEIHDYKHPVKETTEATSEPAAKPEESKKTSKK